MESPCYETNDEIRSISFFSLLVEKHPVHVQTNLRRHRLCNQKAIGFCFRTFDLDTCRRNEMSIEVVQWKSCGVVSRLCVKNRTRAHPIGESATNQRDTQTDR